MINPLDPNTHAGKIAAQIETVEQVRVAEALENARSAARALGKAAVAAEWKAAEWEAARAELAAAVAVAEAALKAARAAAVRRRQNDNQRASANK